ncbi:MAG: glycosyltransferase family 4 protein [Methanomassiliicoccales archaeon]|nr:glycosyltransferase family 4 protein [Methanomassiliicoccales archaeon]
MKSIYLSTSYMKELPLLALSIFKEMRKRDVVYIWFGDLWALIGVFIAKLLNKKSIVVAGGYDTANEPSLNYGLMSRKFMRYVPILSFRACDKIMAVSEFTKEEALRIIDDEGKIEVVPNGIDTSKFRVTEGIKRTTVTTVGNVNKRTWVVKGVNNFMEVVKRTPQQKFVLVGRVDPGVGLEPLENLELIGYQTGEDLIRILNASKYYLQLSYRESFGVAVIESMACGCIPVVTNRGGLPEAVGDAGTIVEFGSWGQVVDAISTDYDPEKGAQARERVVKLYDNAAREKAILGIIGKMLAEAPSK